MSQKIKCIVVDDEPVAREILENFLAKIPNIELVASCKNGVEAFQFVNESKIDLIFLDINMPEISGLSFVKSIRKDIKIIFTTAYREYAIEGFDLQAVDYLLKPISFDRLLQSVHKYIGETTSVAEKKTKEILTQKTDFIFVRSDRKMVKINFSEINYIESFSDYVKVHLNDKVIVTRETISNIEIKLPYNLFLRSHRSYIVSLDKIDSYTNEYIEVDKKALPISRTYKKDVLLRLDSF